MIIYNLISKNSGIEGKFLTVLDTLQECTSNFEQLSASGEDAEYLKGVILQI